MRKEELLEELDTWKALLMKDWIEQDEQAYKEIVALIKKPQITEEWYEEKADLLYRRIMTHDKSNIYILKNRIKDFIRSFVEEIEKG